MALLNAKPLDAQLRSASARIKRASRHPEKQREEVQAKEEQLKELQADLRSARELELEKEGALAELE